MLCPTACVHAGVPEGEGILRLTIVLNIQCVVIPHILIHRLKTRGLLIPCRDSRLTSGGSIFMHTIWLSLARETLPATGLNPSVSEWPELVGEMIITGHCKDGDF